jgi:two-component system, NtrC family, sensor kinase
VEKGSELPSQRNADGIPSRRTLGLVVAAVCALAVAVVAVSSWQDRERRLEAARREAVTLARVLEEQTASVLGAADLALLGIAEGLRRDPALAEHDPAFEDSLRRLLGNLPAVRALFVIGSDGFIVQDSDRDTPRRNLADRDYFRAHAEDPNRGFFVGAPLVSRSVNTWFIGLSRRVETPQGGFAGVATAALDVPYFERFYEGLELGVGDAIMVTTRDTVLLARQPAGVDDRIGLRLVSNGRSLLEEALAQAPAGTFEAVSPIDGASRVVGYRAFADHPLVVLVGLSWERVLTPWRRAVAAAAAATVATFALGALLLWLAMRYARRDAKVQARAAEAAKLETLGRLTSGVAHDFNNLLQATTFTFWLLGKRAHADALAAEMIQQGLASMEHGRNLVAQLLGVARPQQVLTQSVDVNALLAGMEMLLRNAAAPTAQVELELAADLQLCRADPSRLNAAVLNLVVNARDALPSNGHGGGLVQISTANLTETLVSRDGRRLEPGHFVRVTVRDNGVGMAPEDLQRALEPFFTTKGEHGSGLGLTQVDAFVREFGGDVQIESQVGVGTAVHIYLPTLDPSEPRCSR